jgi:hypothetical protein
MSLYAMAFGGTAPFGSMMAGSLASKIGAPNTLIISGTVCIIGSLLFLKTLPLFRQAVSPVYVKTDIVREMPVD